MQSIDQVVFRVRVNVVSVRAAVWQSRQRPNEIRTSAENPKSRLSVAPKRETRVKADPAAIREPGFFSAGLHREPKRFICCAREPVPMSTKLAASNTPSKCA